MSPQSEIIDSNVENMTPEQARMVKNRVVHPTIVIGFNAEGVLVINPINNTNPLVAITMLEKMKQAVLDDIMLEGPKADQRVQLAPAAMLNKLDNAKVH